MLGSSLRQGVVRSVLYVSRGSRHYSNDKKQIHRRDVFVLDHAFGLRKRLLTSFDAGRSLDASVTR